MPTVEECREQVYGQMLDLCVANPVDQPGVFNAAVVNVDKLPGHGQMGTQVQRGGLVILWR